MGEEITMIRLPLFIAIDFDGTVTDADVTDAILNIFAKPGWEEAERRWETGLIGSRECLAAQMSFVEQPLEVLLDYVDGFRPDRTFANFVGFLREFRIPFCIVSDGFRVIIERILGNAGMHLPVVFASELREERGKLRTVFPHAKKGCLSATCKCEVAERLSGGLPFIHVGDGRSDFCIARRASYVFSRESLAYFCRESGIAHSLFTDFKDIEKTLRSLFLHGSHRVHAGSTHL